MMELMAGYLGAAVYRVQQPDLNAVSTYNGWFPVAEPNKIQSAPELHRTSQ